MAEPAKMLFYNKVIDRTAIKQLISRLIAHFGITYTTHILDQLKSIGFKQATQAAISLGIDDLLTAPSKGWLIQDAEQQGYTSEKNYRYGNVHAVEKLRQLIETWYATSEYLKQEMNPNFRMTDPLNPVHMMSFSGARGSTSQVHQLVGMRGLMSDPQGQIIDLPIQSNFREGLSLTEYIISCYGARKGVVDTAVRTSDAGYLTRRLVEVVQHIVVRKVDCGTAHGIFAAPLRDNNYKKNNHQQKLIGRILSDNIYVNERCIAIRNQDITTDLAISLVTLKKKPIFIRSPLTCKSMIWICQLCYGWSLTHGSLIELGEAVGIIAGQSIGEPGTQLTLRTFHTGGVYTGDIAEHVRTPFNGIIQFNIDSVYPTRTRHGHPAWICHNNLSVIIKSKKKLYNLVIPPQSLLLVQSNQYVESKQIIAEVRAKTSPFKEKVQKYIYSNLAGEMHWSAKVQHAPEYIHSNVHLLCRTGHIWILAGNFDKSNEFSFIFYRNQDKLDNKLSVANQKLNYSKIKDNILNNFWNFIYSSSILYTYTFSGIKKRKKTLFFLKKKKKDDEKTLSQFMLKIPKNGILKENDIFAIFNDPKYKIKNSGIIKYGNIKVDLINKKNDIFENKKTKDGRPRYKIIKEGSFFFLPEEVYILDQSLFSSILVKNNSFIKAGTKITSTITSKVTGFVKIKKKYNNFKIKIIPGTIYYPKEKQKTFKQNGILIPPGKKIFEQFQTKNWIYLEWIVLSKDNSFFLIRPAIEYKIISNHNSLNLPIPFFLDFLKEQQTIKIQTVKYIFYQDGEEIEILNNSNIQLIQTCLILNWETKIYIKEAHISFIKIRINKIIKNFFQISLINTFNLDNKTNKQNIILNFLFNKKKYIINQEVSEKNKNLLFNKTWGILRTPSKTNKEKGSFLVLSPSNLFQTILINKTEKNAKIENNIEKVFSYESNKISKTFNIQKKKKFIKQNFLEFLGLLGHSQNITKIFQPLSCIKYNNKLIPIYFSIIDNLRKKINITNWYFLDENKKTHKFILTKNNIFNLLNWSFSLLFLSKKKTQLVNIGHFLCDGLSISEYQHFSESGQIIAIYEDSSSVIRLAKPYLATDRAKIHNNYGEIVKEGDTLITLVYERLKSGDIIQGLPKVEQLLEARPINSVSIHLEKGFEDWNKDMTNFFGSLWGYFLSARISMEQSQLNLVDQIQKVYRSQGVQISDKHIEIIVRQMTSKVITLEDGMTNGFLPGELIEFARAKRMNRALEEVIAYKPVLLGITKASLNTQSFISEASFQETTRVLAKAALRGRIDWLKGLKENVILGGIVPAGTGCQEVIWQITLEKQKNILLKKNKIKLFYNKVKDIFFYKNLNSFFTFENIHKKLKQQISDF
nr:DNA-directed RNA polymerase subunit beta'' [Trematodon longicollis]